MDGGPARAGIVYDIGLRQLSIGKPHQTPRKVHLLGERQRQLVAAIALGRKAVGRDLVAGDDADEDALGDLRLAAVVLVGGEHVLPVEQDQTGSVGVPEVLWKAKMLEFLLGLGTFLALSAPAIIYIWRYPKSAHWPAFWKAFFLWLVSTSPVIGGILLSRPKPDSGQITDQFQLEVLASFTIAEIFVYSAAFLAPVLYVVFDILKRYNEGELRLEREDLANHMRGMQGVFLSSIAILILTLLAYASSKSDPSGFSETYLALFLIGKGFVVYLASLLIWYSVIFWDTTPKSRFVRKQKAETEQFSDDYAKRRDQGA